MCTKLNGTLNLTDSITVIGEKCFYSLSQINGTLNLTNRLVILPLKAANHSLAKIKIDQNWQKSILRLWWIKRSITIIRGAWNTKRIHILWLPKTHRTFDYSWLSHIDWIELFSSVGLMSLEFGFNSKLTSFGQSCFKNCTWFTDNLDLPKTVTEINEFAFAGCTGFDGKLTFKDEIKIISNYSFYNCSKFTALEFSQLSGPIIGNYAFFNCSGFTGTLSIPNKVSEIGIYAFAHCCNFDRLNMSSSV